MRIDFAIDFEFYFLVIDLMKVYEYYVYRFDKLI